MTTTEDARCLERRSSSPSREKKSLEQRIQVHDDLVKKVVETRTEAVTTSRVLCAEKRTQSRLRNREEDLQASSRQGQGAFSPSVQQPRPEAAPAVSFCSLRNPPT